jgi:hypothetical protein
MVRGRHGLKMGAEFRKIGHNGALDVFARGLLIFPGALSGSGISDLLLGFPTAAIHSTFNNQQTLRSTATDFFVQDDWKLRSDLTLSLGLRYEYNTPVTDPTNRTSIFDLTTHQLYQAGTHGLSRSGTKPDYNNMAPRLGFAWTPAHHLVVRAGYGIFYDSGMFNVNSSLYFNPPFFNISTYFPSQTSLLTLQKPFPAATAVVPPPQLSTLSPDLTTAYLQDWNLNLQRDFHLAGALSVAYAGSKGTHLVRSLDLNQPPPGPGPLQGRVPNPGFSNIFFSESGGNSEFQSLQVTFNRRLAGGLSLWAVYILAKSIDDTSAFLASPADRNFPQDSRNYRAERALSSFDIHQRATAAWVYQLSGRSWCARNAEIRAIVTTQGGQPFTPVLRFDNSNTGNVGGNVGSDRPNLVGNPQLSNPTPQMWFNTSAFQIPRRYTFGNVGRNIMCGPGLASWDLSLVRRFRVKEWGSVQFEAQAFNLLNLVNFDLPQLYTDEPSTFGRIFSAKAPRQIQFALRFAF